MWAIWVKQVFRSDGQAGGDGAALNQWCRRLIILPVSHSGAAVSLCIPEFCLSNTNAACAMLHLVFFIYVCTFSIDMLSVYIYFIYQHGKYHQCLSFLSRHRRRVYIHISYICCDDEQKSRRCVCETHVTCHNEDQLKKHWLLPELQVAHSWSLH